MCSKESGRTIPRWLIPTFSLVLLVILAGGGWFYIVQRDRLQAAAEENLDAIARLKVDQIVQWRSERLGDAAVLMESPYSSAALARWISGEHGDGTEQILTLFRSQRTHYRYSDITSGRRQGRCGSAWTGELDVLEAESLQAACRRPRENGGSCSAICTPVTETGTPISMPLPRSPVKNGNGMPIRRRCHPAKSTPGISSIPCIQSWPVPSKSAETLLVERDGDDVLYLNDLRHQARHGALPPHSSEPDGSARGCRRVMGREGIFNGRDYRGIRVAAALKAIPGSAVVHRGQGGRRPRCFAPWRFTRRPHPGADSRACRGCRCRVSSRSGSVLRTTHYRARFLAETARRASEERYRITLLSVGDGVISTDAGRKSGALESRRRKH